MNSLKIASITKRMAIIRHSKRQAFLSFFFFTCPSINRGATNHRTIANITYSIMYFFFCKWADNYKTNHLPILCRYLINELDHCGTFHSLYSVFQNICYQVSAFLRNRFRIFHVLLGGLRLLPNL